MSGGVNAHVHDFEHHSHHAIQAHDHDHDLDLDLDQDIDHVNGLKTISSEFITAGDASQSNVDNAEKVNQAHFSHGHSHSHSACLPTSCGAMAVADTPSFTSVLCQQWVCKTIANNIERPKWPFTTPAVVSLLS